jgi:hypothetical protein
VCEVQNCFFWSRNWACVKELPSMQDVSDDDRDAMARRLASLTAERDQYLQAVEQVSQQLKVTREAAARADAAHSKQTKEDTALFQANLRRLVSEKAALHEEFEIVSGQKDALTEALVKANMQLEHIGRLREEVQTWRQQHAEAAERLQAAFADRDRAERAVQEERQKSAALEGQLAAARRAIETQGRGVDSLRRELDVAGRACDEAKLVGHRSALRAKALDIDVRLLVGEMRDLDERELRASAGAAVAAAQRESVHVSTCVAALEDSEADVEAANNYARHSVAEAARVASARAAEEESARQLEAREADEQLARLSAERDAALGEAAAQRRVADSLRQELRKCMGRAAATAACGMDGGGTQQQRSC